MKSGDAADHRAVGHRLIHRGMLERRAQRWQRPAPTKTIDAKDTADPPEGA